MGEEETKDKEKVEEEEYWRLSVPEPSAIFKKS